MSVSINLSFTQHVPMPCDRTYSLLCDWEDHGRWVPFTKVEITGKDTFVAKTGVWPVVLPDNMRLSLKDDENRRVEIEKTGPYLSGTAGFEVKPYDINSCLVVWREDITVPYVPRFVRPALKRLTEALFKRALKKLPPKK